MMSSSTSAGILTEIVQHKQLEVKELRPHAAVLERQAFERKSAPRSFQAALQAQKPAIIAELKKASPSKGVLVERYHPAFVASAYEDGGAACLSVLTDRNYFQGSLHDLEAARAAVALPVLRKDFVIDRLQVFEAAGHGADAILLIAAVLDINELQELRELAASLQLASLVEVHDRDELQRAIDSGAEVIGVNNRNLQTFEVDIENSVRLSYLMPSKVVRVSESGITDRGAIEYLSQAGFHAFLVGESLMKSANPAEALKQLRGAL
ncbi:MAG TPA: indole-3-glycerol phosphate synthase TrpC [Bryobacteraceae bacterium]|jgi:indole-3-glycerol phosphate synthase|nr:indole-3-glycerol phosphate synthase TrpC [Bryobacteraceae bacterium]